MRYTLIGDDGSRYGPADLATLNQWVREGRVRPISILESETGVRTAARMVPGVIFRDEKIPGAAYGAALDSQLRATSGGEDLSRAWLFTLLSFVCCPLVFSILGIQAALRAREQGRNAIGPLILCGLSIVVWAVGYATRLHQRFPL